MPLLDQWIYTFEHSCLFIPVIPVCSVACILNSIKILLWCREEYILQSDKNDDCNACVQDKPYKKGVLMGVPPDLLPEVLVQPAVHERVVAHTGHGEPVARQVH